MDLKPTAMKRNSKRIEVGLKLLDKGRLPYTRGYIRYEITRLASKGTQFNTQLDRLSFFLQVDKEFRLLLLQGQ